MSGIEAAGGLADAEKSRGTRRRPSLSDISILQMDNYAETGLCRQLMYELPDAYRLGRDATRLSLFQAYFPLVQARFEVVCSPSVLSSHTEGGRRFPASSAVRRQGSRVILDDCYRFLGPSGLSRKQRTGPGLFNCPFAASRLFAVGDRVRSGYQFRVSPVKHAASIPQSEPETLWTRTTW